MPLYHISRPENAGPLEFKPPLFINGVEVPYEWDKDNELTENEYEVALAAGFTISPAGTVGNGDAAAADLPGGDPGGSDTDPLDHDGDGEPGGSLPHEPPALSGKTKAELLAIAQNEGVDIAAIKGTGSKGSVIILDIIRAIEANRSVV